MRELKDTPLKMWNKIEAHTGGGACKCKIWKINKQIFYIMYKNQCLVYIYSFKVFSTEN